MRLRSWRRPYYWLWPRRPRGTYPRAGRRGWIRWTHSAWSESGPCGIRLRLVHPSEARTGIQSSDRATCGRLHKAEPYATLRLPDGGAGGAGGHGGVRLQCLRNRTLARCRLPRSGAARFHGLAPACQFRVANVQADDALRNIDLDAVAFFHQRERPALGGFRRHVADGETGAAPGEPSVGD